MPRLHQALMRELLADIAMGEPAPGEMLPRELDLAKRFDVSRGVIRECIRGLEERGVITVKHGRGATVTPSAHWDVFDPYVVEAVLASPDGERLAAEAHECQQLVEVEAAGLAAERRTPADLDALTQAIEHMAAAAPKADQTPAAMERYRSADLEFHQAVMQASGNRALARMSAPLHRALTAARGLADFGPPDQTIAEYRAVSDAIAAGRARSARAAMKRHLASSR